MNIQDYNPWALYDEMIEGVPEGIKVLDYGWGLTWCYLQSEAGMGLALSDKGGRPAKHSLYDDWRGRDLKDICKLAKSWSFMEASMGIAALNSWYSRPELLDPWGAKYEVAKTIRRDERKRDSFIELLPYMENKDVTVIGHFPHVYTLADHCRTLTVLERNPHDSNDMPDPACEYILPSQDMTLITGTTLINKTAPRLLQLCEPGITVLTGPSTVSSPILFNYGVDIIAGSVVADPELAAFLCRNGRGKLFGEAVQMMRIVNPKLGLDI